MMITQIVNPDGSTESYRSYQRLVQALDQRCPFREYERIVAAIREMRARTYGTR